MTTTVAQLGGALLTSIDFHFFFFCGLVRYEYDTLFCLFRIQSGNARARRCFSRALSLDREVVVVGMGAVGDVGGSAVVGFWGEECTIVSKLDLAGGMHHRPQTTRNCRDLCRFVRRCDWVFRARC